MHTPHGASDDTASKLWSVMRLPPPPHEVLHFSCMKSPENVVCPDKLLFWSQNLLNFETSSGCFKGGVAMWVAVSVHGLYPKGGPFLRDEILENDGFKVSH